MTLELGVQKFSLLSLLAQMGGDDPPPSGMKRKIHWVGKKEPVEQKPGSNLNQSEKTPKKQNQQSYRELSSITLGEVSDAHKYYANQLAPSPFPGWLAPNQFCMIHLKRKRTTTPSAIFGRVKVCYPSDGYAQNVQELELLFPGKGHTPDVVHLHINDILFTPDKPVQSFCIRVRFFFSSDDLNELHGIENQFFHEGFLPEYSNGYVDLLDINEHNHTSLPWMYVISSRWFASIPDSVQAEIREKLLKLIQWNKLIFNYHPELMIPREVHSLNRELGFKPGFTEFFLLEPENQNQIVQLLSRSFENIFNKPTA